MRSVLPADDELPPPRGVRWELSETVRLSLGAKRSSTTRLSPSLRRADAPKTEPPNLTKHQTLQPQYGRGSCAPLMYAPRWRMELGLLHLSCPTIVYGAGARTVRDGDAEQKDGYDQNNMATTTNSKEPIPKKTTTLCHRRTDASESISNLTKHQTLQPQYGRGSRAPLMYAPRWRMDLDTPFVLPDNGLRFSRSMRTRGSCDGGG
jgi:hypothetical protein